jgi:hypothetical protein
MTRPRMITRFQKTGAIAGTVNCSYELRTPTTIPVSPSRTTVGKSTRESPTTRSSCAPS